MLLIYISLMSNDIDHFFTCIFAMYKAFLVKCCSNILAVFSGLFINYWVIIIPLCILDTCPFSICTLKCFLQVYGLFFHVINSVFQLLGDVNFHESNFFPLMNCVFVLIFRKCLPGLVFLLGFLLEEWTIRLRLWGLS